MTDINSKPSCQRCGEEDDELRTIWHACGYAMEELAIPLTLTIIEDRVDRSESGFGVLKHRFYTMRICKPCRSDWMHAIENWFTSDNSFKPCGGGIYIRDYGANREITEEEWYERHSRVKPNTELF